MAGIHEADAEGKMPGKRQELTYIREKIMSESGEGRNVSIGELAREYGLTTRTLRYWEEAGIVESVQRADGANREYTPYFLRRIRFILKLKELGLTIKEMQDLYLAYGDAKSTDSMIPRLIQMLDQHIEKVDLKTAQLACLRKEIAVYRGRMRQRLAAGEGDAHGATGEDVGTGDVEGERD